MVEQENKYPAFRQPFHALAAGMSARVMNKQKKHPKYRNKKTVVDGITFDSKKEAAYYQTLKLLEKSGAISNLKRQVKFEIIPQQKCPLTGKVLERASFYIADFEYWDRANKDTVIVDVKGVRTADYRLKKKLMLHVHGLSITEI